MADPAGYRSVCAAARRGLPGTQPMYEDPRTRIPDSGARPAASASARARASSADLDTGWAGADSRSTDVDSRSVGVDSFWVDNAPK